MLNTAQVSFYTPHCFYALPSFCTPLGFYSHLGFHTLFCSYALVELDDPRQQIFKGCTKMSTLVLRVTAIS